MRLAGPIFTKELIETSRRGRYYLARVSLVALLLLVLSLLFANSQFRHSGPGELAKLGNEFFQAWVWCQFCLLVLLTPILVCGVVAGEKEAGSLELLFTTDLSSSEILLGKLASRMFLIVLILASSVPVVVLAALMGGVDYAQLGWSVWLTLVTCLLVSAISLHYSLRSSRPWIAILRTYFAGFLLWFVCLISLIAGSAMVGGGGQPGDWFWWALGLSHPLFDMGLLLFPGPPVRADRTIPAASAVWLTLSAIIFLRSCRRLRRAATETDLPLAWHFASRVIPWPRRVVTRLAAGLGSAESVGGALGRLAGSLREWVLELNPILYRNAVANAYDPERHLASIQLLGWPLTGLLVSLSGFLDAGWALHAWAISGAVTVQMIALHAIIVTVAAGSISRERERGTLDLLRSVGLSRSQIVLGHMAGVFQTVLPTILLVAATVGAGWVAGVIGGSFSLAYLGVVVTISLSVAAGAILVSTACSKVATATALGLVAPAFFWLNGAVGDAVLDLVVGLVLVGIVPVALALFPRSQPGLVGVTFITVWVPAACLVVAFTASVGVSSASLNYWDWPQLSGLDPGTPVDLAPAIPFAAAHIAATLLFLAITIVLFPRLVESDGRR